MKLLSLDNYCFSEWWASKARNEQLIVQPKFDGCALGLRYQSGTLVAAFTRSGKDVTEAARTICNLPLELPEDGQAVSEDPVEIRGELYGPNLSITKSQALAGGHLRKKNPTGAGLSFVAYEILGSTQIKSRHDTYSTHVISQLSVANMPQILNLSVPDSSPHLVASISELVSTILFC